MNPELSVIIPVYREGEIIDETLSALIRTAGHHTIEMIVVDGHPDRDTMSAIRHDVIRLSSPKGRGIQMNRGAETASGNILLFLHADTRLPDHGIELILNTMADETIVGGAFDLSIDGREWGFRLIERVASRRSRLTRIPYGDQAIFIRTNVFRELGGYPEIPLMEDVALMRGIKRAGYRIHIISEPVSTSARRWRDRGLVRTTLLNWSLVSRYLLGADPEKLARSYYR